MLSLTFQTLYQKLQACDSNGLSHGGESSSGRTTDSDSVYRGSNPRSPTSIKLRVTSSVSSASDLYDQDNL